MQGSTHIRTKLGEQVTTSEFDALTRSIKSLNDAGIDHGDLLANLHIQRDSYGNYTFYALDFEGSKSNRYQDIYDIANARDHFEDAGVLAPRGAAVDGKTSLETYLEGKHPNYTQTDKPALQEGKEYDYVLLDPERHMAELDQKQQFSVIKKNVEFLRYATPKTQEYHLSFLQNAYNHLEYASTEVQRKIVEGDPASLLKHASPEVQLEFIRKDGLLLEHLHLNDVSPAQMDRQHWRLLQKTALEQNPDAIRFVTQSYQNDQVKRLASYTEGWKGNNSNSQDPNNPTAFNLSENATSSLVDKVLGEPKTEGVYYNPGDSLDASKNTKISASNKYAGYLYSGIPLTMPVWTLDSANSRPLLGDGSVVGTWWEKLRTATVERVKIATVAPRLEPISPAATQPAINALSVEPVAHPVNSPTASALPLAVGSAAAVEAPTVAVSEVMHTPKPAGFDMPGTALGFSGLMGTIDQYRKNGYDAAYGGALTATGMSFVDDLTHNKLLGRGKLPMGVGALPDVINLAKAQNDDQRNAAVTSLTVNVGTTLALRSPLLATSSLTGPMGVAVVMATSYVAENTVTPMLKIADGVISSDYDKVAIGLHREGAGLSKLGYKFSSTAGLTSLTGDIVKGAGDTAKLTGDLVGAGQSWVLEQLQGKNAAATYDSLRKNGIYIIPNDASNLLGQVGDGLNWVGEKIIEVSDWVTDTTGNGKELRDASKKYTSDADALQKQYDEAHAPRIQLSADDKKLDQQLKVLGKAQGKLAGLLKQEKPVDPEVLAVAEKGYKAAHATLTKNPLYAQAGNDAITTSMMDLMRPRSTIINQDIQQHISQFDAYATQAVALKRDEVMGGKAQESFTKIASQQNANAAHLQHALQVSAMTDAQLKTLQQGIEETTKQGLPVDKATLDAAKKQVAEITKQRNEAQAELAAVEKSNDALLASHKKTSSINAVYANNKQVQQLGAALAQTDKATDAARAGLQKDIVNVITSGLDGLKVAEAVPASTKEDINQQSLQQLLDNKLGTIDNAELKAQVLKQAANLVAYYTQGIDENGKKVEGSEALTDGKLDDAELATLLTKLNTSLQNQGVTLASANAASLTVTPAANEPTRRI